MTMRFEHLPVVFMRPPRVPTCVQRDRAFRLRVWAGITAGLLVFWYGLFAWALS